MSARGWVIRAGIAVALAVVLTHAGAGKVEAPRDSATRQEVASVTVKVPVTAASRVVPRSSVPPPEVVRSTPATARVTPAPAARPLATDTPAPAGRAYAAPVANCPPIGVIVESSGFQSGLSYGNAAHNFYCDLAEPGYCWAPPKMTYPGEPVQVGLDYSREVC